MTDWRRDIENAPRDGSYILVSLKERHWYDGPQVVCWHARESYWWLSEGWSYTDDEIAGWFAIPQADH